MNSAPKLPTNVIKDTDIIKNNIILLFLVYSLKKI
jgi:hypothetical protein